MILSWRTEVLLHVLSCGSIELCVVLSIVVLEIFQPINLSIGVANMIDHYQWHCPYRTCDLLIVMIIVATEQPHVCQSAFVVIGHCVIVTTIVSLYPSLQLKRHFKPGLTPTSLMLMDCPCSIRSVPHNALSYHYLHAWLHVE